MSSGVAMDIDLVVNVSLPLKGEPEVVFDDGWAAVVEVEGFSLK